MMEFGKLLVGTVWLRPYVFVFLLTYLVLATWQWGWGRTSAFLVLGYLVAFGAELSSIHTGFPFGWYFYIPATRGQELWVAGVPFMDSLSYVFLAYASYTMALLALGMAGGDNRPYFGKGEDIKGVIDHQVAQAGLDNDPAAVDHNPDTANPIPPTQKSFAWRPLLLGGVLMTTLDVVIDPLALRGYRWFLGQIYGYPEAGVYFGVPLSNFGGWLVVSLVLIGLLERVSTWEGAPPWWDWGRRSLAGQALLGPGLYLGILAFNLFMTFWIGEYALGWVGVFIYVPFLTLVICHGELV